MFKKLLYIKIFPQTYKFSQFVDQFPPFQVECTPFEECFRGWGPFPGNVIENLHTNSQWQTFPPGRHSPPQTRNTTKGHPWLLFSWAEAVVGKPEKWQTYLCSLGREEGYQPIRIWRPFCVESLVSGRKRVWALITGRKWGKFDTRQPEPPSPPKVSNEICRRIGDEAIWIPNALALEMGGRFAELGGRNLGVGKMFCMNEMIH